MCLRFAWRTAVSLHTHRTGRHQVFFGGGGGGGHFEMLDNTYGIISLSSFTVCASNKSLKTLNLVCKVIIQTRLCCSWKSGFHLIVLGTFAFSLVLHYVVTRLPYKTKTRNICSVRNETKTNRVFPRFASDTCIKKKKKLWLARMFTLVSHPLYPVSLWPVRSSIQFLRPLFGAPRKINLRDVKPLVLLLTNKSHR